MWTRWQRGCWKGLLLLCLRSIDSRHGKWHGSSYTRNCTFISCQPRWKWSRCCWGFCYGEIPSCTITKSRNLFPIALVVANIKLISTSIPRPISTPKFCRVITASTAQNISNRMPSKVPYSIFVGI
ncbi:unnamed protein product [Amaranthus hypochondriacus]